MKRQGNIEKDGVIEIEMRERERECWVERDSGVW